MAVQPQGRVVQVNVSGGTFEASGVVQVPGTEAVLFVDDGRTTEIFWMRLGEDRKQSGAIKTIDIGTSIIDLEGITTDGAYFYVVGSQSKAKGGDLVGLARHARKPEHLLEPDHIGVERTQAFADQRQPLRPRTLPIPNVQCDDAPVGHGITLERGYRMITSLIGNTPSPAGYP